MTYLSEVLADSPYFYWRLGESSGTSATDTSGNARAGTYAGGVTLGAASLLTSDPSNTAASFDGVNDYINSTVNNDPTSFTAECWFKSSTPTPGGAYLLHRWSTLSSLRAWYLAISGSGFPVIGVKNAANADDSAQSSAANLNNGVAHHIVGTYDGTTIRLYVDGTQVATKALAGPIKTTGMPFQAAAQDGTSSQYQGVLDEVAYYTTALSAGRILAHYNAGVSAPPDPPEILTTVLPDGQSGVPYETELEVDGTAGTWSITSGSLPIGLALDPDTGIISGAPFGAGESCFEVTYTETVGGLSDTMPLCIEVSAAPPPPTPSGDVDACGSCQDTWRLELLDLETGTRVGWLKYFSFEIDDLLNQVGPGQVICNVQDVQMKDVWPHLRAIAFNRVSGPGASASAPVIEAVVMIETVNAESGGTLTLGVQSIEHYLSYRIIRNDTTYTTTDQNAIGEDLVNDAAVDGIQLTATADISAITRTRSYLLTDDKVRLEAITELVQTEDGPDYVREHSKTAGVVSTNLRFTDYAGNPTPAPLNAKRGLIAYAIEVDSSNHANLVQGRGEDVATAYTANNIATSIYPRFDKAIQWSDVTSATTVEENTIGYANANGDPIAIPDVTVADPNLWVPRKLGDSVALNIDHGAIRFFGPARIVGRSLSSSAEAPALCTFSFAPLTSAQETILGAPPSDGSGCC